jgi:hypothetical protein
VSSLFANALPVPTEVTASRVLLIPPPSGSARLPTLADLRQRGGARA